MNFPQGKGKQGFELIVRQRHKVAVQAARFGVLSNFTGKEACEVQSLFEGVHRQSGCGAKSKSATRVAEESLLFIRRTMVRN